MNKLPYQQKLVHAGTKPGRLFFTGSKRVTNTIPPRVLVGTKMWFKKQLSPSDAGYQDYSVRLFIDPGGHILYWHKKNENSVSFS